MEQLGLDGPLAWRTIPLVRKRLDFRILGDIADAEIAATGSGIREIARLRKRYGRGRWRKRKGTAETSYLAVRLCGQSYTGTRRRESGVASSRSNASCEVTHYGQSSKMIRIGRRLPYRWSG